MKRMIDNKDYEELKNDVNDLNEKVNNIKGIPTITIDVSQMTSLNTFNLTDEQIETLENNSAVYVILPNGNSFTLLKEKLPLQTNDYINFVSLSFDINQDEQVENYIYAVSINKYTKTGNVEVTKIESGKQLYQHNIFIKDTNRDNCRIYIEIPNDNQTSFNFDSLKAWLIDKGFSNTHMYKASGNWIFDNTAYDIDGVGYLSTNLYLNGITKDGTTSTNKQLTNTNLSFQDSVITL